MQKYLILNNGLEAGDMVSFGFCDDCPGRRSEDKVSRVLHAAGLPHRGRPRSANASTIMRDPDSRTYLVTSIANSKHYRLLRGGRVSKAPAKSEYGGTVSIFEAYRKRMRDARDEGGEDGE